MIKTVFICGPTAVGKTEYAIRLAKHFGAEIISADSMQIYKYMNIGSAKPTKEEQAQAKHHLIDFVDPRENFSVFDFQKIAMETLFDIAGRGVLPIVSGGTGLYVNSLLKKMDFLAPKGLQEYRENLVKITAKQYCPEKTDFDILSPEKFPNELKYGLFNKLKELNPASAESIHPNNTKRILRAIERIELGEEKFSEFSSINEPNPDIFPVLICLNRNREELYDRINRRVDKLYEAGLVEEVKDLLSKGFKSTDISMKGIGYKEIIDAINNGQDPESAKDLIKQSTRHLAKRQLTWFRRYEDMKWINIEGNEFDTKGFDELVSYINSNL